MKQMVAIARMDAVRIALRLRCQQLKTLVGDIVVYAWLRTRLSGTGCRTVVVKIAYSAVAAWTIEG